MECLEAWRHIQPARSLFYVKLSHLLKRDELVEKEMEGNGESGYERATTADVTSSESPPFLCSLRSSSHFNNLKAKIFAFFQENATQ